MQADVNNVRLSIGSLCQPDTPDILIYQKYIFTHPSAQQNTGNVFIKRLNLVEFQLIWTPITFNLELVETPFTRI